MNGPLTVAGKPFEINVTLKNIQRVPLKVQGIVVAVIFIRRPNVIRHRPLKPIAP